MTAECWIAVYSKPHAQARAKWGIEAARLPVFCPVSRQRVRYRDGERYVIITPLFDRYLFARCDPGRSDKLSEIDGIEAILRTEGRITRVPDNLVEAFQRAESLGVFDRADETLKSGETVRVIDGPYAGLIAKVRSAKVKKRVQLMVDFIQNLTISVDKLERVCA
jgi:transcriptional antiterminator RfaH